MHRANGTRRASSSGSQFAQSVPYPPVARKDPGFVDTLLLRVQRFFFISFFLFLPLSTTLSAMPSKDRYACLYDTAYCFRLLINELCESKCNYVDWYNVRSRKNQERVCESYEANILPFAMGFSIPPRTYWWWSEGVLLFFFLRSLFFEQHHLYYIHTQPRFFLQILYAS